MAPKVRKPQQQRAKATRQGILDAAVRLYARQGFYSVNTKMIAAEAGVGVGTVYNYFPDKKALFLEVLVGHIRGVSETIAAKQRQALAQGLDGPEFVRRMVQAVFDAHTLSPDFHKQVEALRHSDEEVAQVLEAERAKTIERATRLIKALPGAQIDDPEAAAYVIGAAIEAVVHSLVMFDRNIDPTNQLKALSDMVSRFLFPKQAGFGDRVRNGLSNLGLHRFLD